MNPADWQKSSGKTGSSLPLLHHFAEVFEEVVGVVGAGAGFGVVLHAEEWQGAVAQAFEGVVVEVDVGEVDFGGVDGVGIDGEVVIVRGDLDFAGVVALYGMIAAVVAEFKLVGFAAEGEADELVAEADAEDGRAAGELADAFPRVGDGLGVAGAVREEDAVGLESEHIFGRGLCGDDGHAAAFVGEHAQDIFLDAVVVGDDVQVGAGDDFVGVERVGTILLPLVAVFGGDDAGEVGAVHFGDGAGLFDEDVGVGFDGGDDAAHDAVGAEMADEGAGVDLGDDRDVVVLEVFVGNATRAPVGGVYGKFAGDEAFDVGPGGFVVRGVGAVVADLGIGEDDNLAGVGGIGEDLLITSQRCIENDFSAAFTLGAVAFARKDAPVFERKNCLHCRSVV